MPKIAVSMQDFTCAGEFGPISFGLTRRQLRNLLGEPENWGPHPRAKHNADIWKYGNIEFYFDDSSTLWMIFTDHVKMLDGGKAIEIDPWIVSGNLTVKQALREFEEAGLPCERIDWTFDDDTERFRVGAGVELIFADPRYDSDPDKELRPLAPEDRTFHGFSYPVSAKQVTP